MPRDRALLVAVKLKRPGGRSLEESLRELSELTRSAGGAVSGEVGAPLERPTPNFFIASGKLAQITQKAREVGANLIIFNVDLSPVQSRNIESATGLRVVDRTGLILDIFARRAQSREGRLQVELAQLNYLLPRLVGMGVIMSRLGGGIGTRGPGEQKLEMDRRKIRERIGRVRKELEKVSRHRCLIRTRRKRKAFHVAALVGYTNAGKSTLLNALTDARAVVEDKMFATLDPTTRVFKARGHEILFTDTVGFLTDLPHSLIEAFHATLEEIQEADVMVHVLDAASPSMEQEHKAASRVLAELEVETKPLVLALNKMDLMNETDCARVLQYFPEGVLISAKEKLNLDRLIAAITRCLEHGAAQPL